MPIIDEISGWLIVAILAGAVMRIVYCCLRLIGGSDQNQYMYKSRAQHALVMAVIAMCIYGVRDLVLYYFR